MTKRCDDTGRAPRAARPQRRRAGFTMLEVQVAFILLGIGLSGACPLIVMQCRLSTKVAAGFPQNGGFQPGGRTFLVPQTDQLNQPDRWRRKLGASATLSGGPADPCPVPVLQLVSWGNGSGVPTSGVNLVIVGLDTSSLLNIRVFDAGGNKVTDTIETALPSTAAAAILTLKQQLPALLPPHVPAPSETSWVLLKVTSILSFSLKISAQVSPTYCNSTSLPNGVDSINFGVTRFLPPPS